MTPIPLAICRGEPGGIGPEVTAAALEHPDVLACCAPRVFGTADPHAPPGAAREALDAALDTVAAGLVRGVVTAPASKHALGGTGHTEVLRARPGGEGALMTFVGPRLRVVVATEHVRLADVAAHLSTDRLIDLLRRADAALRRQLGCAAPRIAVCGLNPHAGEGGLYGDEDARLVAPAVAAARARGVDVRGPFGADGLMGVAVRGDFDLVVALYHDQGLAPFKALHFRDGVHFTAGMAFPRTSPVHGTARDIAGRGCADPTSMIAAIRLCAEVARRSLT